MGTHDVHLQRTDVDDFFGGLLTATDEAQQDDELDTYLVSTVSSSDILAFWRDKSVVWPKLSSVAKVLLAIPATETSSERVFSVTGQTIEDR